MEALTGDVREHHRPLLQELLALTQTVDRSIEHFEQEIERRLHPFEAMIARLCQITGVSRYTLHVLFAEVGSDMVHFPDAAHLASWAGAVRCITGLDIPGAARKNSKGGSWVNGLPHTERPWGTGACH